MNILIVEPYYTGSHKQWAEGYKKHSNHKIKIISMKGQFWKWRMHGGAVTLAKSYIELNWKPDVIFCSDMLDLSTFLSLTRKEKKNIPVAIYFHENQNLELYHLPSDIGEQKNLVKKNTEETLRLAKTLTAHLIKVEAQMPKLKETGQQVPWPLDVLNKSL